MTPPSNRTASRPCRLHLLDKLA